MAAILVRLFVLASTLAYAQAPVKIAGESHKLILFSDGSIGGWGDTRDGQLGPRGAIPNVSGHASAYVPIAIPYGKVIDIAAGGRASYALLADGTVAAFGRGAEGQLGCGEVCLAGSETPVLVTGLRNVASIAAGGSSVFAIHRDGSVSTWGERSLGEGSRQIASPETVAVLPPLTQISVGSGFVLALTREGRVWMWGRIAFGRIYSDDPVQGPAEVPDLTNVAAVAASQVAAVLKKDGTVWVWGNNAQAQFGNGKRDVDDRTSTPVRVPGIANAVALTGAINGRHYLVLLKDGSLRGWGNSDWGQLGAGVTGREQASPIIPRLSGVKAVFAAGNNSFAIRNDGSLWIWGLGSAYRGVWPMTRNAAHPVALQIPAGVAAP